MMFRKCFLTITACVLGAPMAPRVDSGEASCFSSSIHIVQKTSGYWFELTSRSAPVGEVIAVDLNLHIETAIPELVESDSMELSFFICHDPKVVELLGEPDYSDWLVDLNVGILFYIPVDENFPVVEVTDSHGFVLIPTNIDTTKFARYVPSGGPIHLLTAYYRVKGGVGASSTISFCENVMRFVNVRCTHNEILSNFDSTEPLRALDRIVHLRSTRNHDAIVTVTDGPPTRTERPPAPPEAEIYPEVPTSDAANVRVRFDGGSAVPGQRDVPVEVYVTADVDYTGIILPIDFDERYLTISRVESRLRGGSSYLNNENNFPGGGPPEGGVVLLSSLSNTISRLAPVHEELHIATLYFDVKDAAAEVEETFLRPDPVRPQPNSPPLHSFIYVRTEASPRPGPGRINPEGEIALQIAESTGGSLKIARTRARLGDVNLDGVLDSSDAISVLGYLFLGQGEPDCVEAGDVNEDGKIDISDPISILTALFHGVPSFESLQSKEVFCR